jgi:hypothetical protein
VKLISSLSPLMLPTILVSVLSFLACTVSAVPGAVHAPAKRDTSYVLTEVNNVTSVPGESLGFSTNGGASWKSLQEGYGQGNTGVYPFAPIGYRVGGKNATAVVIEVRVKHRPLSIISSLCAECDRAILLGRRSPGRWIHLGVLHEYSWCAACICPVEICCLLTTLAIRWRVSYRLSQQ